MFYTAVLQSGVVNHFRNCCFSMHWNFAAQILLYVFLVPVQNCQTMTSCRIIISVTIMEFDFDFFSRFWYQSVGAKERILSMYSCSFLNQCWSHSRSEKSIVEQVQAETSSRNKGGKHSYKTRTVFDEKGTAPPVASLSLLLREPYSLGISREHKQKITADIHKTSWNSLNEKISGGGNFFFWGHSQIRLRRGGGWWWWGGGRCFRATSPESTPPHNR